MLWWTAYNSRLKVVQRCLSAGKRLLKNPKGSQELVFSLNCSKNPPIPILEASHVRASGKLGFGCARAVAFVSSSFASLNDSWRFGFIFQTSGNFDGFGMTQVAIWYRGAKTSAADLSASPGFFSLPRQCRK